MIAFDVLVLGVACHTTCTHAYMVQKNSLFAAIDQHSGLHTKGYAGLQVDTVNNLVGGTFWVPCDKLIGKKHTTCVAGVWF